MIYGFKADLHVTAEDLSRSSRVDGGAVLEQLHGDICIVYNYKCLAENVEGANRAISVLVLDPM